MKIYVSILGSLLLLVGEVKIAAYEGKPPLAVLFIGNSYTAANDLPSVLSALAADAGGRAIEVARHTPGGCTFERHVLENEAIDKIKSRDWDVVVLQEQSFRPVVDRGLMHEYARKLDAEVKKQSARTVFYLTWARQHIPEMQEGAGEAALLEDYARRLYALMKSDKGRKPQAFDAWFAERKASIGGGLNEAYLGIADELEAGVAPVGIAWQRALAADHPAVLHRADRSHPTPAGTYLAACVFYATLLEKSPQGLTSKISKDGRTLVDLGAAEAHRLQRIAWNAVRVLKSAGPGSGSTDQ